MVAIRPVLVYACETWPLRMTDIRALGIFDRWCIRRILRISWMDRVSNIELYERCPRVERLESYLQRRRLQWFGHVLRKSSDDVCRIAINPPRCSNWSYRHGGQLKTWISTIKADASHLGLVPAYGLCRWNRNWVSICEEFASVRSQWYAAIRDINVADPTPCG